MHTKPNEAAIARTQLEVLFSLAPGHPIEARDRYGNRWLGVVDATAPDHGIVWIYTDLSERKLLDLREHSIRRFP